MKLRQSESLSAITSIGFKVSRTRFTTVFVLSSKRTLVRKRVWPTKADYLKLCGQDFWEFISGNPNLYIDIIKPLGHRAKERNEAFQAEYAKVITRFTGEFIADFCTPDGAIVWEKVLKLNSGSDR